MTESFIFVASDLWLDFLNTQAMSHGVEIDLLESGSAVDSWLKAAALPALRRASDWRDVYHLRSTLRAVAADITAGKPLKATFVAVINDFLQRDARQLSLQKSGGSWSLVQTDLHNDPLARIAASAASDLAAAKTTLIRQCEAHDCILYFYDGSKSGKRRWCSMKTCGNRAKVAAFLERKQGERA